MLWRLALVQLFFTLGWTVYVIFLPRLLKRAGIDAAWLPWILIADQLLFAAADVITGMWLDRGKLLITRAGNWLAGLVLASCTAFLLLPLTAGAIPSGVFLALLFLWVILSSVLRVPPLVLLAQSLPPQQPGNRLTTPVAAYLFGIGLAGAIAPYLTVMLKNQDPLLPFVIASAALAVAVLFLRRQFAAQADATAAAAAAPHSPPLPAPLRGAFPLLIAVALFAFGMQLHTATNSAKLFATAAPGVPLEWLMPLFWAGFSVAMFPVSLWLTTRGQHSGNVRAAAGRALWLAGLVGGAALGACALAPPLPLLIVLQIVAGAAWAAVFLAALSAAADLGRCGREGGWIGAMLALFALAAVGRTALVLAMSGNNFPREVAAQLPFLAAALWMITALPLALCPKRSV